MRALERAGVDSGRKGAQLFRHSLAQRKYAFPSLFVLTFRPVSAHSFDSCNLSRCLACLAVVYALSLSRKKYTHKTIVHRAVRLPSVTQQVISPCGTRVPVLYMLTGGVVGDQGVEFFEEGGITLSGILFQRFAIVREIVKKRLDAHLV